MTCSHCRTVDRRTVLGLLGVGVASVLAGCAPKSTRAALALSPTGHSHPTGQPQPSTTTTTASAPTVPPSSSPPVPETSEPTTTVVSPSDSPETDLPVSEPGGFNVVYEGPPAAKAANQIAITIDDGFCAECADAYVTLAQTTGIHLTFNPNGCYGDIWNPMAERLKPLIEQGQVQIGNHTYNHSWVIRLSDSGIREQLERNEEWIEDTFGINPRPWWRPPYGSHDERTDEVAASLGYTNVLIWNGSYGDSNLLTPDVLMAQAEKYLRPGVIMLGHANFPTVSHLFDQIAELISSRELHPVTLDEMFLVGNARRTYA